MTCTPEVSGEVKYSDLGRSEADEVEDDSSTNTCSGPASGLDCSTWNSFTASLLLSSKSLSFQVEKLLISLPVKWTWVDHLKIQNT